MVVVHIVNAGGHVVDAGDGVVVVICIGGVVVVALVWNGHCCCCLCRCWMVVGHPG